jgi:hypothetical protein
MDQYIKENRTEAFRPIYKRYKEVFKPTFEIDNLFSQITQSKKMGLIYCNSIFAEETIDTIIHYFNEQSVLNNNFKNNILNEIKNIEFAYPTDNKKLETSIVLNAENSFTASANGMRNILEAFIKCSDFESNSGNSYFEDIDYIIETENETHNSAKLWVVQTIDEPWFE